MLCEEEPSEVEVGGVETVSGPSVVDCELLLDVVVFKANDVSLASSCLCPDRGILAPFADEGSPGLRAFAALSIVISLFFVEGCISPAARWTLPASR